MSNDAEKVTVLVKRVTEQADHEAWGELTKAIDILKNLGAGFSLKQLAVPLDKHWVHHKHGGDTLELDVGYLLDELKHQIHKATEESRHAGALHSFLYRVDRMNQELVRRERELATGEVEE